MTVQSAPKELVEQINQQIKRLGLDPDYSGDHFNPEEGLTAEQPSEEYINSYFLPNQDSPTQSVKIIFGAPRLGKDCIYKADKVLASLASVEADTPDLKEQTLELLESCEY